MRDEGHGLVPADSIILSQRPCNAHPRTLVKSKNGVADTQSAQAQVQVRVLLDPGTTGEQTAAPGEGTFDKRCQELMPSLAA